MSVSLNDLDGLFQPFQFKSLHLKNRIVMAPMTRSFSPEGVPGADVAAYYRRRAEGGVGLILSEGTVIDRPSARNKPSVPFFHGEEALEGWKQVIGEVHSAGGRMGPQIWHVGASPDAQNGWAPPSSFEGPSGLVAPGRPSGETMTGQAIADTIAAYARAAGDARRLGFDVVEIHGAHGYLIDQFFWNSTNLRTDHYGGRTLRERSRFACELIRAVRLAVGPDFPVVLRLSQFKLQDFSARLVETPEAMAEWLVPLVEAGVDILHCSQRRFWEPEFPEIDGEHGLNFAGWAKKLTGVPTISVGSVGLDDDFMSAFQGQSSEPASLDALVRRLEREEFDLIAVGRALLADSHWASKVQSGDVGGLRGFRPDNLRDLA
jgi:2,4-dienoyl-CoA reductase-like NADH-dependent reductase (Old Yellow Enzyme family)